MMANKVLPEYHLIKSWQTLERPLKTKIVVNEAMTFEGIQPYYLNFGMMHIEGSKYLMTGGVSYELDIDAMVGRTLPDLKLGYLSNVFFNGDLAFYVQSERECFLLQNGYKVKQFFDLYGKMKRCHNTFAITGRWSQSVGDHIYVIQYHYNALFRLSWTDLRKQDYNKTEKLYSDVEDFFATEDGRLAVLLINGQLLLPPDREIDLKPINGAVKWTIVVKVAGMWIISGDSGTQSTLICVTPGGRVKSKMSLDLTPSTYSSKPTHLSEMYCIKPAIVVNISRAVFLAIERDGACNLLSLTSPGRLSLISTISTMAPSYMDITMQRLILSATVIDASSIDMRHKRCDMMIGGCRWTKRLTIVIDD